MKQSRVISFLETRRSRREGGFVVFGKRVRLCPTEKIMLAGSLGFMVYCFLINRKRTDRGTGMDNNIAQQLRQARTAVGLTQEQLAEKINYSRSNISHWENGKALPDAQALERIEVVLECRLIRAAEETACVQEQEDPEEKAGVPAKKRISKRAAMWVAAVLCVFAVGVGLWQVFVPRVKPYSVEWYHQTAVPQEGQACIEVSVDQDPVTPVYDENEANRDVWIYKLIFEEIGGVDFRVTEVIRADFTGTNLRGTYTWDEKTFFQTWGDVVAEAYGKAEISTGLPVQYLTGSGFQIFGTDANGNALEFRGFVNYTQKVPNR